MKFFMFIAALSVSAMPVLAQTQTDTTAADQAPAASTALPMSILEDEMTAEMLAGAEVFSIDGDGIGEVSDIVFTTSGDLDSAVISVGGFLGFGQHSVAIPVAELNVMEKVDTEGEVIVQVPLTKAQMKALPEYETPAAEVGAAEATE